MDTRAGAPCPVFIAGFRYRSIFEAAGITHISSVSLNKSLKKSDGAPVAVRRQIVVAESWVSRRCGGRQ